MADNLKKKKADGKRIALGQKHERDYLKRIAKQQLFILEKVPKGSHLLVSVAKLIRICKALLKCLEKL